MAYISTYKGLKIVKPEPLSGAGGSALNDNFKAIANHIQLTNAAHSSTAVNTANRIVQRGAAGEFAAGAITGSSLISSGTVVATGNITGANITGTRLDIGGGTGTTSVTVNGAGLIGYADSGSAISATFKGALAHGFVNKTAGASTPRIDAFNEGAFAGGYVKSDSSVLVDIHRIFASGLGSFAHGYVKATGANVINYAKIDATGIGSCALGTVAGIAYSATANIAVSGAGSFSHGFANSNYAYSNSEIITTGAGSSTFGYAKSSYPAPQALIMNSGKGSLVFGYNVSGYIETGNSAQGSLVFGKTSSSGGYGAEIESTASAGCLSAGAVYSTTPRGSYIKTMGKGNHATGYALDGYLLASTKGTSVHGCSMGNNSWNAFIKATANGATAFGYVQSYSYNSQMHASGKGSFASGYIINAGYLISSGVGSHCSGYVNISVTGAPKRIESVGKGSFAQGFLSATGNAAYSTIVAIGDGSHASGMSNGYMASYINSVGDGAFAHGFSYTAAGGTGSDIAAYGVGSVALGSVNTTALGQSIIQAAGIGSFACGSNISGSISSTHHGSWSGGYVYGTYSDSKISSYNLGSFAHGCARNIGGYGNSEIKASGKGSFAHGYATSDVDHSRLFATGDGSFAIGRVRSNYGAVASDIQATGVGSFAGGYAYAPTAGGGTYGTILSSDKGSFAWGYSADGAIAATASNAIQFGVGTNNVSNSLQVGPAGTGVLIQATGAITTAGSAGANFGPGAITNLTVVNGIVTAAS